MTDLAIKLWEAQFGGGMIPFDIAYRKALGRGAPLADAQLEGVSALLRKFVEFQKEVNMASETLEEIEVVNGTAHVGDEVTVTEDEESGMYGEGETGPIESITRWTGTAFDRTAVNVLLSGGDEPTEVPADRLAV